MTVSSDRLRTVLAEPGCVQAPGCYDAVSALLLARAGFSVAHFSGAIASAVTLGLPDLGYIHGSQIAEAAQRITSVIDLPLIADADTGYGNALHARRTVEHYAHIGIAGLHIEDQINPKRCGHMAGKEVIDQAEAVQKVRAVVEALLIEPGSLPQPVQIWFSSKGSQMPSDWQRFMRPCQTPN